MDPLMIVAGVVIVLLVFLAVYVFVDLAALPGRVAVRHNHSQPEAVRAAGIVGLLAGGVLWPFALAWAYVDIKRLREDRAREDITRFSERLSILETRLASFVEQGKEPRQ